MLSKQEASKTLAQRTAEADLQQARNAVRVSRFSTHSLDGRLQSKSHPKLSSSFSASEVNSLRKRRLCSQSSLFNIGHVTSTIGSFQGSNLIKAAGDHRSKHVDYEIFSGYDFPFENLVFEGGGNKGYSYSGSLEVSLQLHVLFIRNDNCAKNADA